MKKSEADQKALLFQSCKENTFSSEEALIHYECITELLDLQKSRSLIDGFTRKKGRRSAFTKGFLETVERRLEKMHDELSSAGLLAVAPLPTCR